MYEIAEFTTWEAEAPDSLVRDPLWQLRVYRLSLFAAQRAADDAVVIASQPATSDIANQLSRAVGSVGANIAEGYSQRSGRDRARLLSYALGSAREALHWYRTVQGKLPSERISPQFDALDQIRRMLMSIIPKERALGPKLSSKA